MGNNNSPKKKNSSLQDDFLQMIGNYKASACGDSDMRTPLVK